MNDLFIHGKAREKRRGRRDVAVGETLHVCKRGNLLPLCLLWDLGRNSSPYDKAGSQQQIKYRENGVRTHGVLNDILKQLLTHLAAAQFSQTQANE